VRRAFHGLANFFQKDKSMRKLVQASLLSLALTATIYAGDMGQPVTTGDIGQPIVAGEMGQPIATQGDMPNGIIEIGSAILEAMLSLI
jgi:hypothetical protein